MAQEKLLIVVLSLLVVTCCFVSVDAGIPGTRFVRGDANNDGTVNLADGLAILDYLFGDSMVPCQNSADTTDDGQIDVSDAIYIFSYLFLGGAMPVAPFPDCGPDQTDDPFECLESNCP